MSFGLKGKVRLIRSASSRCPWYKPHSNKNFCLLYSKRWSDPVTVLVAPIKVISTGYYRQKSFKVNGRWVFIGFLFTVFLVYYLNEFIGFFRRQLVHLVIWIILVICRCFFIDRLLGFGSEKNEITEGCRKQY